MRADCWRQVFGSVVCFTVFSTVAVARPLWPLSQEGAAQRAVVLLTGFGIPGPVRVTQSGRIVSDDIRPTLWDISLVDARKQTYRGLFRADGRLSVLSRTEDKRRFTGWKSRVLPLRYEQLARRWLAVTGTKEATRLAGPLLADNKGIGRATFKILRNGYPFVSHSRYGYQFTFDVAKGTLIRFESWENPPPVTPDRPKLDEKAALARLDQIWDTKRVNILRTYKWRRYWYELGGKPELGYYLPEGKSTAILVWRMPLVSYRDVGHAIQGGTDGMLIDAVTGEEVRTRTVP